MSKKALSNTSEAQNNLAEMLFILFIFFVVCLVPIGFLVGNADAAEYKMKVLEFTLNQEDKIIAPLGKKNPTKIEISQNIIKNISGDSSQYNLAHDIKGKYLLLLPNTGIGEKIEISVTTISGKIQKFAFIVTEDDGRSIKIFE